MQNPVARLVHSVVEWLHRISEESPINQPSLTPEEFRPACQGHDRLPLLPEREAEPRAEGARKH